MPQSEIDIFGQTGQLIVALRFGAHVEAPLRHGVHHLLQLTDGADDAPGEDPATDQRRQQGTGGEQQGTQQGSVVVGLLFCQLLLDQLVDVGGHAVDLLDQLFTQFAEMEASRLVGDRIAATLMFLRQQRQHVAAGMAEVGLQGGSDLTVIVLGTGEHQTAEDGVDLLLGAVEACGQCGKQLGIVEAIDGAGAQPVGGVDQFGNIVLVLDHALGRLIYVIDGFIQTLFADGDHHHHQQAGQQQRYQDLNAY